MPFCLIFHDSGSVGAGWACWQVLSARAKLSTAPTPVCATLFVSTPTKLSRHKNAYVSDEVYMHLYPTRSEDHVDLPAFWSSALRQSPQDSSGQPALLFIDSLDSAILYHGLHCVIASLRHLLQQRTVSGILAVCHSAHPTTTTAALKQLATCILTLKPSSSLQSDVAQASYGRAVHTELNALTLRHSGATAPHCQAHMCVTLAHNCTRSHAFCVTTCTACTKLR